MTKPLVIIQTRTGSRRLPGKALLDFHGLPLAALAARRAANQGARVIVATSDDPSDDALANNLTKNGNLVVRGPLDDVLGRFELAIGDAPDAMPVVRLTGDNVVPDGAIIADVLAEFEARGLDYITTTDLRSGLPYGCAVEITRVQHLRNAAAQAQTAYEREHVTPFIRDRFGVAVSTVHAARGCGHLRCTVDSLDDYLSLLRLTPTVHDLTQWPWYEWITHLQKAPSAPLSMRPVKDLVLGTAQLGSAYGIARRSSPNETESHEMLRRAISEGVGYIDTARAYGKSEALIGELMSTGWDGRARIVTKLSPLDDVANDASSSEAVARAEVSLLQSCVNLRNGGSLETVLLHRAEHLHAWNGAVWDTLCRWRDNGRIRNLGVSIQSPTELDLVLKYDDVDHVQLPSNIIDYRWDAVVDQLREVRRTRGLVVHVRGVLMQGLLSSIDPNLWRRAHVEDPRQVTEWLSQQASAFGHDSVVSLCLAWARGLDWADGVVVGCDSLDQLHDTVRLFNKPALSPEEINTVTEGRPYLGPRSLDPAQWVPQQPEVRK